MTESEAIKELRLNKPITASKALNMAVDTAIQALEEAQAYRAIGTIEEFKALKEKAEPKKVIGIDAKLKGRYCPGNCEGFSIFELKKGMNYCPDCGQRLDWQ